MHIGFLWMVVIKFLSLLFTALIFSSCATVPSSLTRLDPSHTQAIVVEADGLKADITLWEKVAQWQKIYQVRGILGRSGLAKPDEKREGDGKTPQGVYALKRAFGYDKSFDTKLDYRQVTKSDLWVDDPKASDYNQWVKTTNAASFETLRREDDLYEMALVIEYNTDPVINGNGSAIFMHVWRNYYKPTAGCVALSSRNLRKILAKLNPTHKPVIILEDAHGR